MQEGTCIENFGSWQAKLLSRWSIQVGTPSPEVSTPSSSSTVQVIRLIYGQTLAKELLTISVSSSDTGKGKARASSPMQISDGEDEENVEAWNAQAHFTNANYQAKKMQFLLFINRERTFFCLAFDVTLYGRPIGGIFEDQEGP